MERFSDFQPACRRQNAGHRPAIRSTAMPLGGSNAGSPPRVGLAGVVPRYGPVGITVAACLVVMGKTRSIQALPTSVKPGAFIARHSNATYCVKGSGGGLRSASMTIRAVVGWRPGQGRMMKRDQNATVELVIGKCVIGPRPLTLGIGEDFVPHVFVAQTAGL